MREEIQLREMPDDEDSRNERERDRFPDGIMHAEPAKTLLLRKLREFKVSVEVRKNKREQSFLSHVGLRTTASHEKDLAAVNRLIASGLEPKESYPVIYGDLRFNELRSLIILVTSFDDLFPNVTRVVAEWLNEMFGLQDGHTPYFTSISAVDLKGTRFESGAMLFFSHLFSTKLIARIEAVFQSGCIYDPWLVDKNIADLNDAPLSTRGLTQ